MADAEKGRVFHFRQFDVAQDRCAMKVGTDGVLLGAWFSLSTKNLPIRILDIGTGTGLIALMAAQRIEEVRSPCQIDAIEIDPVAAAQAHENFEHSPWAEQITLYSKSLGEFLQAHPNDHLHYDLIISNPPFYNATLKPEDTARATARHKDSLPLTEIMNCAQGRLTENGRLALVYPMNYDNEAMTAAIVAGLKPLRLCNVLTKEGKICKRRLAEFGRSGADSGPCLFENLSIRDASGDYTQSYKNLTAPFYIDLK